MATADKAAKAAYDRARYAARYVDARPQVCARVGCGQALNQPARGYRLYCSESCGDRAWWAANYVPVERTYDYLQPLPMAYIGDDVFREARRITGLTGTSDWAYDILGAVVLALIEGSDPLLAAKAAKQFAASFEYHTKHVDDINQLGYRMDGTVTIGYQEPA